MAEQELRGRGLPESAWPGLRFRWAENPEEGMWASIVIEIERRGEAWVVVRLDRGRERVSSGELGFAQVASGAL